MSYPDKPYSALGPLGPRPADSRPPRNLPDPQRIAWFDDDRVYRYRLDLFDEIGIPYPPAGD